MNPSSHRRAFAEPVIARVAMGLGDDARGRPAPSGGPDGDARAAQLWRSLTAASPIGIFEGDLDGHIGWANTRLTQIWGVPMSKVAGRGWIDGVHPDDAPGLLAGWRRASAEGREYELEFRVVRPEGELRWVHGRSAVVWDEAGRAIGTVGTVEDVTERRVAEQAARALAAEREATLGQMTDGVIVTDEAGRIVFVNAAAAALHGVDLIGVSVEEFTRTHAPFTEQGDRYSSEGMPLSRAVRYGETIRDASWRIVRPDGSEVTARGGAAPVVDSAGNRLGAVLVMRDVTIERITQQALAASEARFRAIADNIPNLAFMADPQGAIYWFNQRWLDYTGASLHENRGEGWMRAHHPDHSARVVAGWKRACETGRAWEDTFPLRSADGRWRWFLSRAEPIRDAAGRIERWFGTNTDVTEQHEADARKNEFLAMLAHELRNPLAPVLNAARYLQRGAKLDEAGTRALDMIERQARQMGRLVDDLLEVSRITRGRIDIRPEPMLLGTAVDAAAETLRNSIDARGQRLEIALPAQPLRLSADPVRIAQILENLLANASKYTPAGGEIRVVARSLGGQAEVRVTDTGIGIAAADLDRVFEPFVQLDATLDRSQGGLGIGLALVAQLVRLHGGSVQAESAGLGKGACFVLRLPLA